MLDSEDSTVTYMELSSPFEGLSDIGSPGVNGLPWMPEDPYVEAVLQASPSPDYAPDPEHPPTPEFVSEPVYPKFMPPEDDRLPAEKDDDDDEEEEESSRDEVDDEEEDEDKEEEEEENTALAESIPSPLVHRTTARISIPVQQPTSFWSEVEIDRLLDMPLLPSSPLFPWSLPLPQIPSPPLPVSPPLPAPRSETPSLLPIPLPTSSPPLFLPSMSHRADVPEVTLPPRKRSCIALGPRFKVGKSSSCNAPLRKEDVMS
nr:hypothetical protein [Tanacetum cinerariifolium]